MEYQIERFREMSDATLQELELSRRALAADLAKQLRALVYEMVSALTDADLARLVREGRNLPSSSPTEGTVAGQLAKLGRSK